MVQFFATFEVSIQALELKPKGQKSPEPSHVEALVTFGSFLGMWEAFTLSQLGQARKAFRVPGLLWLGSPLSGVFSFICGLY